MLLTDEEIIDLFPDQDNGDGDIQYGRAIEAAVLAKLREQAPVGWITPDGEGWRIRFSPPVTDTKLGWSAIFEHPAPIPEGWISVDDRLPEQEQSVLVSRKGRTQPQITCYYGNDWILESIHYPVTHWMPLPPMAAARSAECNHHYVIDQEAVLHKCCQKCGDVIKEKV